MACFPSPVELLLDVAHGERRWFAVNFSVEQRIPLQGEYKRRRVQSVHITNGPPQSTGRKNSAGATGTQAAGAVPLQRPKGPRTCRVVLTLSCLWFCRPAIPATTAHNTVARQHSGTTKFVFRSSPLNYQASIGGASRLLCSVRHVRGVRGRRTEGVL